MDIMNIEQRFRSIIWPVTFFISINTAAVLAFVFFRLDMLDQSSLGITLTFRLCVVLLSIAVALLSYIRIKAGAEEEHKSHLRRKERSGHLTPTEGLVILVEDIAIGLLQALFIFIFNVSFWLIINFTTGPVTFAHAFIFWLGLGVIMLAAAYVIVHRLALAILAIRK